ncbi:unnamed protein product [Larinioides sclopetarius]|uniref:Uncharacterized protein n=1 Tax=Larinioides sclopetarius TaxID=280406 RepID=A0AAV2AG72_9ARAC
MHILKQPEGILMRFWSVEFSPLKSRIYKCFHGTYCSLPKTLDKNDSLRCEDGSDLIRLFVVMKDTDAVVLNYNPLFGRTLPERFNSCDNLLPLLMTMFPQSLRQSFFAIWTWELFGYTGGLVGCWLGFSVWSLVGIIEKFAQKVGRFREKLLKK